MYHATDAHEIQSYADDIDGECHTAVADVLATARQPNPANDIEI